MTDAQTPATPETPATPATPAAPATPTVAAGWYSDPSNPAQQRWWDGTKWTEQVSAPATAAYVSGDQLKAPAGTNGNTPWIWLVVFLPLLSLIPLAFVDFAGYIEGSVRGAEDPASLTEATLALYTQPAMIIAIVLSLLSTVGIIVFAYLDWRELTRRGVPAPFHWAFSFLALASLGIVYPIGRAVVTKRRTGSGNGVLLATILTIVAAIVFTIVLSVLAFNYALAVVNSL